MQRFADLCIECCYCLPQSVTFASIISANSVVQLIVLQQSIESEWHLPADTTLAFLLLITTGESSRSSSSLSTLVS